MVHVLPCGSGLYQCRIDPLRFLAGWRKRRLNQAFSFVLVQLDCACVRLLLVSITFVCMCMWVVFYCILFFIRVGLIDFAVNFCWLSYQCK